MKGNPKIIFMGTPDIAAKTLKELIDSKTYKPALAITQKDKPVGRKRILSPSPVKLLAEKNKLEIFQPEDLKEKECINKIRDFSPDIIIVVAYGKIIPKEIIDIPKFGILNVHASLLPKYRGASPVQSAILEGEKVSGVTIMKIDQKLDYGPILAQKEIIIDQNETSGTLFDKISKAGAKLLLKTLPKWLEGKITPKEQEHKKATFTKVLARKSGEISKNKTAKEIDRMFRAFYPWPGVYLMLKTKKGKDFKLKITKLSLSECDTPLSQLYLNEKKQLILKTKDGCVNLEEVQPESKNKMSGKAFYQGYKDRLFLSI